MKTYIITYLDNVIDRIKNVIDVTMDRNSRILYLWNRQGGAGYSTHALLKAVVIANVRHWEVEE